jgi:hypothetical protein
MRSPELVKKIWELCLPAPIPSQSCALCLRLAKELCSAFSLCAKLISHVATSMRMAALLPPQAYGHLGTAAGWIAVHEVVARSRAAVAAEVLFLRKQLAYYQDHRIRPCPLTDAARRSLVLWSRLFDWERSARHGHARNLRPVASQGFQAVLALEVTRRTAGASQGHTPDHRSRGEGEITRGEERVADELSLKLSILVSPRTVRKYWPLQAEWGPAETACPRSAGQRSSRIMPKRLSPATSWFR